MKTAQETPHDLKNQNGKMNKGKVLLKRPRACDSALSKTTAVDSTFTRE